MPCEQTLDCSKMCEVQCTVMFSRATVNIAFPPSAESGGHPAPRQWERRVEQAISLPAPAISAIQGLAL
jgi:hypothetical protein